MNKKKDWKGIRAFRKPLFSLEQSAFRSVQTNHGRTLHAEADESINEEMQAVAMKSIFKGIENDHGAKVYCGGKFQSLF